jgi:hypothetical protein
VKKDEDLHNFNICQSTKIRYRSTKRVPIQVSAIQIIRTCALKKKKMHKAHSQMRQHIILISFNSIHTITISAKIYIQLK